MAITIISAILIFSVIIFVHEFGHFIMAKAPKVAIVIKKFSLKIFPLKMFWIDFQTMRQPYLFQSFR